MVLGANTGPLAAAAAAFELAAALGITLALGARSPPRFWRSVAAAAAPFLAAVAWGALPRGAVGMRDAIPPGTALELVKLCGAGACVLAGALVGLSGRGRRVFADALVWGGLAWALLCLWLRQADVEHVFGLPHAPPGPRFSGTLLNANTAGCLFGMIALIAFARAQSHLARGARLSDPRELRRLAPPLAAVVANLGAEVFTWSRSDLIFTAALAALMTLGGLRPAGRSGMARALPLGAAGLVLLALSPAMWWRMGSWAADWGGRAWALGHYFDLARRAPLTGFGLGSFRAVNAATLTTDTALRVWDFSAAHNAALQAVIEGGWPWLAMLLAAVGVVVAQVLRRGAPPPGRGQLRLGFAAAGMLAVLCSTIDIALEVPAAAAFACTLLGLVWGAALGRAQGSTAAAPASSTTRP